MDSQKKDVRILMLHLVDREDQYGGVEKIILDLSSGLCQKGIRVGIAINPSKVLEKAAKIGIPCFPLSHPSRHNFFAAFTEIRRVAKASGASLIQSHHRYATFCAQVNPLRRYYLVHTFHVEQFTKKALRFFGDEAVAVSHGVRRHFVKEFGVEESKITVIHNGVDPPPVLGSGKAILRKRPDQVNIVLIGRLEEQKGHEVFLAALERLDPLKRARVKAVFLGEGTRRPLLEKTIRDKRLSGTVELIGHRENVFDYLLNADFSVHPSLWEGFGLSVIESYLCGKPVIATSVGGLPEVVEDGRTGRLIPPRDPEALARILEEWIEHPERVKAYGEAAREYARTRFSKEKMVAAYAQFYERIWVKKQLSR